MKLDLTGIAARLRGSISDGWSGDAFAADADNAEEAAAALIECRDEIERLRAERDDAREQRRRWQEASVADRAEGSRLTTNYDALLQQALGVEAERDIARMENERLRAALVSIGVLNASGGHYDPEIDKVIRAIAYQQLGGQK